MFMSVSIGLVYDGFHLYIIMMISVKLVWSGLRWFLSIYCKRARLERSNDGSRSAGEGLCVLLSFLFTTQQEH